MAIRRLGVFAILPVLAAASAVCAKDYTVKPGDTLTRIAQAELGSSNRWPEIAARNKLAPPYAIRVGQRLVLPDAGIPSAQSTTEPEVSVAHDAVAGFDVPSALGLWLPVALFLLWVFTSICVRIACWFSLVETTFGRCSRLSFLSAALLVAGFALVVGLGYLTVLEHIPSILLPLSAAAVTLGYFVASILLTRRILLCKWRSVITVGVMSGVVADILAIGLMAILFVTFPAMMATEALKEFYAAVCLSF